MAVEFNGAKTKVIPKQFMFTGTGKGLLNGEGYISCRIEEVLIDSEGNQIGKAKPAKVDMVQLGDIDQVPEENRAVFYGILKDIFDSKVKELYKDELSNE